MKTITTALEAHLEGEVTTLCCCWRIVRTDGVEFYFTDHDVDVTYDGNLYEAESGLNRTALSNSSDLSVANAEITGVFDSDKITKDDLRAGLYDLASVYLYVVNWANPAMGAVKVSRGFLGAVTLDENGKFESEIRGLSQALSFNVVELFGPECRTDFCSSKCGLSIANFQRMAAVMSSTSRMAFVSSTLPAVETTATSVGAHKDWRIRFTSAVNSYHVGLCDVMFWDQSDALISGETETQASSFDNGSQSSYARDGRNSTEWRSATDATTGSWWAIRFASAKDVKEFLIQAPKDFTQAPSGFTIEYSDDTYDLSSASKLWHSGKVCSADWTTSRQSAIWGFGSTVDTPINYPDTRTSVDAPLTGASTYIGGTVAFRTGQNKGITMEIVDYDDATGEITLFEEMPYPILAGDTFMISQGCDKAFSTCKVYDNVNNFRGEPSVPGQDQYLWYPNAS